MKPVLRGLLGVSLALAFAARGMAYACAPQPAKHDCCGKSTPAAPKTPCAQMTCCQVLPTATALASQKTDIPIIAPGVVFPVQALDDFRVVPAFSDGGPPGSGILAVSDRSPPVLLG